MNWNNIKLIVSREIRDQLRDQRTIFVIAILPLLLYPLLGMSFLQVAQFMRESPTRVWIIGAEQLPSDPALLVESSFREDLLLQPSDARLFNVVTKSADAFLAETPQDQIANAAKSAISAGEFDAVVYISPEFADSVERFKEQHESQSEVTDSLNGTVGPEIFSIVAKDKSRVAHDRVGGILSRWTSELMRPATVESEPSRVRAEPFTMVRHDLSENNGRRAALWSKILPFIIIVWAVTGAFYPAIDLCAGEKERGTLETLLSSPASRHDIVAGKLLTVMVFSIATSLLNLVSMGMTGKFVMAQVKCIGGLEGVQLGPPPVTTLAWLVVALIPIAALFSALSLALAAMARSSKEGQYYLMPLMLGTMPLMMLPMMPGVELDLGNSLIPVAGVVLLLRSLIEGDVVLALQHAIPVICVTGICCWLAMLWAIHQFQDERVLFHESEQFSLKSWIVHIFRDRENIPTIAQAFLCAVLLLMIRFFGQLALPLVFDWNGLFIQTAIVQLGFIAAPAVLMAVLFTRKPSQTLLLQNPSGKLGGHVWLVIILALTMHPVVSSLSNGIRALYPISEQTMLKLQAFHEVLAGAPNIWMLLLMIGVMPAICEELAFRGFILSGMRRMQNKWLAVLLSSLFFGIAHQMLQQSIAAFAVGLLIGYIAIQTNSIIPCMVYHLVHNSLPVLVVSYLEEFGAIRGIVEIRNDSLFYDWPLVSVCVAGVIVCLWRFQNRELISYSDGTAMEPQVLGA